MEFLTSDRSTFSRQARLVSSRKKGRKGVFAWTMILTGLTALTIFSWTFCVYVFGHPEKAFNYNLLTQFEKLPALDDYSPSDAPRGTFHTPRELYRLYYRYGPRELRSLSSILRRAYITNFRDGSTVTYLQGNFRIYEIRTLKKGDVFPSGLALRAQALEYPNVVVEYILPAASLPEFHYDLETNNLLEIESSTTCAAVIHVAQIAEDYLCFTIVPIVYGTHRTPAQTSLALEPPNRLNLYGRLPITREPETSPIQRRLAGAP